jgi:hypothetical protein
VPVTGLSDGEVSQFTCPALSGAEVRTDSLICLDRLVTELVCSENLGVEAAQ